MSLPPERTRDTAIVGIGNILMGDEGIGVRTVEVLQDHALSPGTGLFDGGTAFQALIGELEGFDRLIVIDAIRGGEPPGTIYRFDLEDLLEGTEDAEMSPGHPVSISLHDMGVLETLALERLVERASGIRRIPANVVVVGIEPQRIELSIELSPTLKKRLPALVQTVLGELAHTSPTRNTCARVPAFEEEEPS